MECAGSTKAIVRILPPNWEEITFGSPPVGVEVFERPPRWQINYSYEFFNGNFWESYSYYAQAWGEPGEVQLRIEESEDAWKIWITGRYPQADGLLGATQESITEQGTTENRPARNFQILNTFLGIPRAWKLVISDISGPVWNRFYEQEPEYKIICGCKVGDCEIPCASKPEGFCCLSRDKVRLLRRKLDEDKKWYEKELW